MPKKIPLPDKEEFENYFFDHENYECVEKYKVSTITISRWAKYFGFKKDISIQTPNKEEFEEYFFNHTSKECEKKYNVSKSTISRWAKSFGFLKNNKIPFPDKEDFESYFFSHTNSECSKKYKVSDSSINRWVNSLGITKTIPLPNKKEFIDYYFSHSVKQSCLKYGVSTGTLKKWLKNFEVKNKKILTYESSIIDLKLTESQKNIFIGTMLGDASINYKGINTNSQYILGHGFEQIEYLKNISCLLFPFTEKNKTCRNKRDNSEMIGSISHKIFTEYEKIWYLRDKNGNHILKPVGNNGRTNRIKIVPKYFKLNPEILAYWYFDDGNLDKKYKKIILYTNGFTENEVNYLIFRLKNDLNFFNPRLLLHRQQPIIKFIKKDLYHFIDLVKPFNKFECMKYKTDISNLKKSIKIGDIDSYTTQRIKEHEKKHNRVGITYATLVKNNKFRIECSADHNAIYFGNFENKSMARKISNDILKLKKQGITDIDEYLKIKEKYKDLKN